MDETEKTMLKEIHSALVGNEYKPKGLIHTVEEHETKINRHEIIIRAVIGIFIATAFIAAFWSDIKSLFQ